MASNGSSIPSQKGVNSVVTPLNRADEVDDVSDCAFLTSKAMYRCLSLIVIECCTIAYSAFHQISR